MTWNLIEDDCLVAIKDIPDKSIDALITDPPAGMNVMSKKWDSNKGGKQQWCEWLTTVLKECFRVMKPGAHAFIWASPKQSHWVANSSEDAGFAIKNIVHHLYASGFPVGVDVGKEIDKRLGAERKIIGPNMRIQGDYKPMITEPATEEAKKWDGWKSKLKPAVEHWLLLQKQLEKLPDDEYPTIAANVLTWGTGAMNVKACQGSDERFPTSLVVTDVDLGKATNYFPNFEDESLYMYCSKANRKEKNKGLEGMPQRAKGSADYTDENNTGKGASNQVRQNNAILMENYHPTVKPLKLMRWLCRLITPPEGVVLDPFAGSCSTGVAALQEGFKFIGIESDHGYFEIAKRRLETALT